MVYIDFIESGPGDFEINDSVLNKKEVRLFTEKNPQGITTFITNCKILNKNNLFLRLRFRIGNGGDVSSYYYSKKGKGIIVKF